MCTTYQSPSLPRSSERNASSAAVPASLSLVVVFRLLGLRLLLDAEVEVQFVLGLGFLGAVATEVEVDGDVVIGTGRGVAAQIDIEVDFRAGVGLIGWTDRGG